MSESESAVFASCVSACWPLADAVLLLRLLAPSVGFAPGSVNHGERESNNCFFMKREIDATTSTYPSYRYITMTKYYRGNRYGRTAFAADTGRRAEP